MSRKMAQDKATPELVTVAEAARRLGKSSDTVSRWIRLGRCPYVEVGPGTRLVNWTALGELTRLPPQEGGDE